MAMQSNASGPWWTSLSPTGTSPPSPTFADLEAVIAGRCRRLDAETIKPHTDFHWWPKPIRTN
jgi:hypothetical protein